MANRRKGDGPWTKPVAALREWNRLSRRPEVQGLSHPGFRWFHGLFTEWTGRNNGVIEFAKKRHGARIGLGHSVTFEQAKHEVLASGLVTMTQKGGRGEPALYMLTSVLLQASPNRAELGATHDPSIGKILGSTVAPTTPKSWVNGRPKLGQPMTQ